MSGREPAGPAPVDPDALGDGTEPADRTEEDDTLLADLRDALTTDAPPPAVTDLILTGYDLITGDAIEAVLTADSARHELAVRSAPAEPRLLTYEAVTAGGATAVVELEVSPDALGGFVSPPDGLSASLEQGGRTTPVVLDELGGFRVPLAPVGAYRLRFTHPERTPDVVTPWLGDDAVGGAVD